MKRHAIATLALGVFALAAYGQQQPMPSNQPTQSVPPSQTAKPNAPPTDPTATTSTMPAPPAQAKEDKSVNANKQGQQGQRSQLPQSDVGSLDTGGISSAELQRKIEAALHSEPTLSGSNLTVVVKDDAIELSGMVSSAKERTTASRIAQSFGENRKLKDTVTVGGAKK